MSSRPLRKQESLILLPDSGVLRPSVRPNAGKESPGGGARTEETEKEDYVHQDNCWVSGLVYLSRTNLDSGTQFYDSENGNITQTVKFVQNRAVFFKASMWHRVLNGHGTDIGDGRYTLNTFFGYL